MLGIALAIIAGAAFAAPPLPAFTARYRLLQNGTPIGNATLRLAPGADGTWTFTTESSGSAGLAALLGASVREVSTFRWSGGLPQGIAYDYSMQSALNQKQRSVRFDWQDNTVTVDDKGEHHFAAQPGTLERHTLPLAIAAGLDAGKHDFALPVAVLDRVETQHFAARGDETVRVPAGTFRAVRVSRTDSGEGFDGWFVPGKLPVPVRIDQHGRNNLVLELESYSAQ